MSFRSVAVGDSVVWGQGLAHPDKFVTEVVRELTGDAFPKDELLARSGAVIGPVEEPYSVPDPATETDDSDVLNEIPYKKPIISDQIERIADPAGVDLLFLDGGANDVGLDFVGNPFSSQEQIEERLEDRCYRGLKELLALACERCPRARIVVTGYYPAVTGDTPITQLGTVIGSGLGGALFGGFGIAPGAAIGAGTAERTRRNVLFFHRRSLYWMRRAVAEVNSDRSLPGLGVLFAHPGFHHENGLYAGDPHVFAPGDDDAKRSAREPVCERLYPALLSLEKEICRTASMLHPNEAGARAYTHRIVQRYEDSQRGSVRGRLSELASDDALSCRNTLERYELPIETGLRTCFDHFTVDTVQVTIETGANGTDSDISLRLGEDRQWLLDRTFFDDPGGFDDFEANSSDSFTIDPILDGSDDPLQLTEIEELTLLKRGIFDWEPEHITVELNGIEVYDRDIGVTLRGDDSWSGAYPRDLLFTEIQVDAPGVPEDAHLADEYVRITNTGSRERRLDGHTLDYSDGQRYHFPPGYSLRPGESVTVRTGVGNDTDTDLYAGYRHAVLNNRGDAVTLRNSNGEVVTRRTYGNPPF